jgi:glycosyltransferase involved in cell wall biosynthesis
MDALLPDAPRVSVVIPAYNYAHYLPAAIGSVLAQTHRALECLVVDDGSTDDTRAVVEKFTDPRVRYVHQPNAGLAAARNTGLREACHEFIGLLDADDCWEPGFLARVFAEFAVCPAACGAIATASFRIDEHGVRVPGSRFTFGTNGDFTFRDFCLRNRPLSSSIVLRRAACAATGEFDPTLRSSEDRDYWLRLTARGWTLRFLDTPLASIRRHRANMSKAARRMRLNRGRVLRRARRAGVIGAWSPFWLRVFSLHFFQSARAYHTEGLQFRAFGLLGLSTLLWPFFLRLQPISEPPLFRLRALAHLLLAAVRRPASARP